MPAVHKKVANPEKEMAGGKKKWKTNKPYQKNPQQPKGNRPAALDLSQAGSLDAAGKEGAAVIKKKIRDAQRLMKKSPQMPADVKLEHERRIKALTLQLDEKKVDQTEQKMAVKYRMIRFFESKKAERKITVFKRQHPEYETKPEEKAQMEALELDLAYIEHFPKTRKYISLYPRENSDEPVSSAAREEIRNQIKASMAAGELHTVEKMAREVAKGKIHVKEEQAKRAEGKKDQKRKREEQDHPVATTPMEARAKATAARNAAKPAAAPEVESFFETVTPATTTAEGEESKKLSKWAKKAIKAQQTFAKVEESTKATTPSPASSKPESAVTTPEGTPAPMSKNKKRKEALKAKAAVEAAAAASTTETALAATESSPAPTPSTTLPISVADADAKKEHNIKIAAEKKEAADKKKAEALAKKEAAAEKKKADDLAKKEAAEKKKADDLAKKEAAAEKKKADALAKKEAADKKKAEGLAKKEAAAAAASLEKSNAKAASENDKAASETPAPAVKTVAQAVKDDSDEDSDDETELKTPVRKIVKVDESLLKELPPVPRKRGGRNLNKYQ